MSLVILIHRSGATTYSLQEGSNKAVMTPSIWQDMERNKPHIFLCKRMSVEFGNLFFAAHPEVVWYRIHRRHCIAQQSLLFP